MIPLRRRAVLPPGHWWIAYRHHGHLVVAVSTLVPPNSRLEHELVREAVRAWRHQQRKGLVLLPAPIAGGAGVGWLVRQFRRPAVAAGATVAAAGIALAAVVTEIPKHPPHRPPTAVAPPARSTPNPSRPGLRPPVSPAPRHPQSVRPQAARTRPQPTHSVVSVSTGAVRVDPQRLPVRVPVRVPPVHVAPPKVPHPPVVGRPPTGSQCRLVELQLGHLAHVCL